MAKPGISKAQGYLHGIFDVAYDLKGAIDAYGVDLLHDLVDAVYRGDIKSNQDKQRWLADYMLNTIDADLVEDTEPTPRVRVKSNSRKVA